MWISKISHKIKKIMDNWEARRIERFLHCKNIVLEVMESYSESNDNKSLSGRRLLTLCRFMDSSISTEEVKGAVLSLMKDDKINIS